MRGLKTTHEEFVKRMSELHPELSVIERYTGSQDKILVRNKYGVMSVYPMHLNRGFKPGIGSAINKTSYFKNKLKEVQPDLEVVSEYLGSMALILVKTKYGMCEQLPANLLHGTRPTIASALNKEEYYANYIHDIYNNEVTVLMQSKYTTANKGKVLLYDSKYDGYIKCNRNGASRMTDSARKTRVTKKLNLKDKISLFFNKTL